MLKTQLPLFYNLQYFIQTSSFYRKYYLLFNSLELSHIRDKNFGVGCTGYSRHAMIRAFIIKHQEEIKSVPALLRFLDSHPVLTEMCGFIPGNLPDESQFYRFLSKTNTSVFENIHHNINKKLIEEQIITLKNFILDSKPIMAATRENNFKNPKRNTRSKNKKPTRSPCATLGYYSYQEVSGKKENYIFFWGYRTHVIVSKQGIPLVSTTLPNNQTDSKTAKKLIKKLKRVYSFKKGAFFIADAAYDEREVYNFIVEKLKCKAFIPINPRNTQQKKTLGPNGAPICEAGFEMKHNGSWKENLRERMKFRCPLKTDKQFAQDFPQGCPVNHQSFCCGKSYGCTKYLDITNDARSNVPRNSVLFKTKYKLRTEVVSERSRTVERYFARLGEREAEQTTHYKLKTIQNQIAIAHLSMSLVAYAAAILIKQPQKIRCRTTFADDWLFKSLQAA